MEVEPIEKEQYKFFKNRIVFWKKERHMRKNFSFVCRVD